MGVVCSSSHHYGDGRYDGFLNHHHDDEQSLNTVSPKLQFGKRDNARTSMTSVEFEHLQTRASTEMKKANSFRIPTLRVNFIGFNSNSASKAKSMEELNLELSTSFLPQHLLYCLRYIYYGGEGKQYKTLQIGSPLQRHASTTLTTSGEYQDNESKLSSFLSISSGSNSKHSATEGQPLMNGVANIERRSPSPTAAQQTSTNTSSLTNKKRSSSPAVSMWKKIKSTSTSKPIEEERMKQVIPMSEFGCETCVLLIEMKGFSKIVDSFYEYKNNYELSDITRYIYYIYTSLIAVIYEMGGDIEKFQGDLIICQFFSPRMDRTFTDSILSAVKCAIRIQSMTNLKSYKSIDTPLQVKCIVSVGDCMSYHLGGFESQWIRIFGGQVVLRVREYLHDCKQGNVYVTSEIYDKCKQFLKVSEELPNLFQVLGLSRNIASHPLASVSFHYTFANALFLFMNRNVLYGIESKTLDSFNRVMELLLCTISINFSSFGSTSSEYDLQIKNNIVNSIQEVSEQYSCCLLDMFFDEKSLKFILSFERHIAESNPSLVVQCVKEVIVRENLQVNGIGFVCGYGFRASVGSDFRRHFGLYGGLIGSSISYCNYAIEHLESGIVCDGTTASILEEVCFITFLGDCELGNGTRTRLHSVSLNNNEERNYEAVDATTYHRASETNIFLTIDGSTDFTSANVGE